MTAPKSDLVDAMIDEMRSIFRRQAEELVEAKRAIATRDKQIEDLKDAVAERDGHIRELQEMNLRRSA